MNNSEEDGLSDILEPPEKSLVLQPKPSSESSSLSNDFSKSPKNAIFTHISPKKQVKRSNCQNKPILDKIAPSSLQRYYQKRKYEKRLFSHKGRFPLEKEIRVDYKGILALNPFENQLILLISLFLPIKAVLVDNIWDIVIESRDFLGNTLKKSLFGLSNFLWLGIINVTEQVPLDQQERLKRLLREKYHCIGLFYDLGDLNKIKKDFFINYFDYCLNFNLPKNSSKLYNYDEQLYLQYYKELLKLLALEIGFIASANEKPLVYILDYQLYGLPLMIKAVHESIKLIFHWGLSFLNDDNFDLLPFGQELFNSLLTCDLLIFNTFQEAKPFFTIFKEKTGLDYSSNQGLLYINYMARTIGIRLSKALLDCEILPQASQAQLGFQSPISLERLWDLYWKDGLEGNELVVSIDDTDRNPSLLVLKVKLLEALAFRLQEEGKKLKFIEIYTSSNPLEQAKKLFKEVNDKLTYESLFLIESEIPESLENALLTHTKFLLETQIYETSLCKIQRFLNLTKNKGFILIPSSFEAWISTQTPNYCSFYHLNPLDFAEKVFNHIKDPIITPLQRESPFNTPVNWLKGAYNDLIACSYIKNPLKALNPFKNYLPEPNSIPTSRINWPVFTKKATGHKNRLIILGLEEVLIAKEAFFYIKDDYEGTIRKILKKPTESLLESLKNLCKNPYNTVYLMTGRGLELLGNWFIDIEALGFANEYGFLHKDPGKKVWHRLFEMDWNWKEIVKKIMDNYTMKTPGSQLEVKESCVIWKYEHSDLELGRKQAEAMIGHLNEVFENNSEIDVVMFDRAVEVRPLGLNKGTLVQMLIEKFYKEKGAIGLLVTIGGVLSDEDMFNGALELFKENKGLLEEKGEVYNCIMGKKPSNAGVWLEGGEDLFKLMKILSDLL